MSIEAGCIATEAAGSEELAVRRRGEATVLCVKFCKGGHGGIGWFRRLGGAGFSCAPWPQCIIGTQMSDILDETRTPSRTDMHVCNP